MNQTTAKAHQGTRSRLADGIGRLRSRINEFLIRAQLGPTDAEGWRQFCPGH